MEDIENLLIDGELLIINDEQVDKLQKLDIFKECRLDIWDDITCDKKDLKSFILTEGMKFIGKGYIKSLTKSILMDEKTCNDKFKLFTYIIVTGTFDSIKNTPIKRKFYTYES